MGLAHVVGFPRIGAQRELTFAMEAFWQGELAQAGLQDVGQRLRAQHWQLQADAGLDLVTVGDFAWYDHVLGTLALLGALPTRYQLDAAQLDLPAYYAMARGDCQQPAMEMSNWFDTNYHFLVPEWTPDVRFDGGVDWLFEEVAEAQALGHRSKVVLLGPLSLLYLGKAKGGLTHPLALLPQAVAAYRKVLARLREQGVTLVQMDEPILALELAQPWLEAFAPVYGELSEIAPPLLLSTYFDEVSVHLDLLRTLPVAGVHLDGVRGVAQLQAFANHWPLDKVLSVGIVDGRNIWRCDLDAALAVLKPLQEKLGERLWLASSCSLLHVPVDLGHESKLDAELKSWLAFAVQKLDEIVTLKQALAAYTDQVASKFAAARAALAVKRQSPRIRNALVQKRLQQVSAGDATRHSTFSTRNAVQQARWNLPAFPTTTTGSFPQTAQICHMHAAYRRGDIAHLDYLESMRDEIRLVVQQQEQLGLDVLVHGEPERNDMVEYFGEQLWGYGLTVNGWVQRDGACCIKPPFIYGDVYRPEAMTVGWSQFAQSLTSKPMKGMLTGPVTMLQWSFVRDDQPHATTALQIALALRDEVGDLEKAGIGMIQIDEPAFRAGLPLKANDWKNYLNWAVHAFKISVAGAKDETQIHMHMGYSAVNDILPWIAAMDADVITIDTSGEEMALLEKAQQEIPAQRLWINPDCGLKTRTWPQTQQALGQMVQAARLLRQAQG